MANYNWADYWWIQRIAGEIAEAIEEAHANHVMHRDLKPDNIMLTAQARAKVMDFGAGTSTQDQSNRELHRDPRTAATTKNLQTLILTMAGENPSWGEGRIADELSLAGVVSRCADRRASSPVPRRAARGSLVAMVGVAPQRVRQGR